MSESGSPDFSKIDLPVTNDLYGIVIGIATLIPATNFMFAAGIPVAIML